MYFDGHLVKSEPGTATNVPLRKRPETTTARPGANMSGTVPR